MYKLLPILLFAYGLALTTDDIYDNSWALIIGINKYENVQKLNYAVDDAESIKDILINSFDFPEENVSLLINEEATKQNIIKSFSKITKDAEANDRVIVFFAGHGETMDLPGGGEKGYLIPVEGDSKDLYVTAIPMDELNQISLMSKAKHMLYLVDACYGGIAAVGSRGLSPNKSSNFINKVAKFQSRQVITAGGRGEKVIEKAEWGHSAFTLNIIRGLQDGAADMNYDGYITANELGMFLSNRVSIDSQNQQTPQYGRMTSQEGEFIFVFNDSMNEIKKIKDNRDTDAKLDALLSKVKKLESEKPLNYTNNYDDRGINGWFDKYRYRTHGLFFVISEIESFSIGYLRDIKKSHSIAFIYNQTSENSFKNYIGKMYKVSIPAYTEIKVKWLSIDLIKNYYINDNIVPSIWVSSAYVNYNWRNTDNNTSGKIKNIDYAMGIGVSLYPFPMDNNFPINPGVNVGLVCSTLPKAFFYMDGTLWSDKEKIILAPMFTLEVRIPLKE